MWESNNLFLKKKNDLSTVRKKSSEWLDSTERQKRNKSKTKEKTGNKNRMNRDNDVITRKPLA